MNTKQIVGRRIVAVFHNRFYNKHLKRMETVVNRIELDDGSIIYPIAFETEDGPGAILNNRNRSGVHVSLSRNAIVRIRVTVNIHRDC